MKASAKVDKMFSTLKRISNDELYMTDEKMGQGVFGVCYSGSLGPLKVCAKVFRSVCQLFGMKLHYSRCAVTVTYHGCMG